MSENDVRWGLYPWFEECGVALIHPDDLTTLRALMPFGKVFALLGEENGFIRLRYGHTEFRARPSLFTAVDVVVHGVGEVVTLEDKQQGVVASVQWHHKRAEPVYQLEVEGKRKTKRYWNSDFT